MSWRRLIFVGWCLAIVLGANRPALSQEEWLGVKVVERRPGVMLKAGKRMVGRMSDLGPTPLVIEAQGDWLRVGTESRSGWVQQRDVVALEEAAIFFSSVIKSDPKRGWAYNLRGIALQDQGQFEEALRDYSMAVRLNPRDAAAHNNRAWLLATCPNDQQRDSVQALNSALQACKLSNWKQPIYLDTLAAAYASTGDFKSAAKWQAQAIKQLPHDEDFQREARERLEMYAAGSGFEAMNTDEIIGTGEGVVEPAPRRQTATGPSSRRRR
jgi:tetratricopeptide (TPR) repeat protein